MRYMSLVFTLCVCTLTFSLSAPLQGAAIHALLVGDTTDKTIGVDCERDLQNMGAMINEASLQTGLTQNITIYRNYEATVDNILGYLNSLQVKDDDVVILYFSMHGYRTPSKMNPWPNLYLGVDDLGIDFYEIVQYARKKSPRFLLSIADVCNNEMPDGYIDLVPMRHAKKLLGLTQKEIRANYRRLFVDARGSITISGCIPGEYSWSMKNYGGAYSLAFLSRVRNLTKSSPKITWEEILRNTAETVQNDTKDFGSSGGQHPQQEIILE